METLIQQAPYIAALVIIVAIFTRSTENVRKINLESEANRDKQWRDFLSEQRVQYSEGLTRLNNEISKVTEKIGEIGNAVSVVHTEQIQHNSWMKEAVADMHRAANRPPEKKEYRDG